MDGLVAGQFTLPGKSRPEINDWVVTVTAADPLCPSLVAVIVALPTPCAVTNPVLFTVATAVLFVVQVIRRPVSGLPLASRGVAVNCPVCPTVRLRVAGVTLTDATGTSVTVMVAVPLLPSLVAVMVAVPAPRAVTSPVAFTVATAELLVVHVTTRPVSGLPLASRGVAVSWPVCPTGRLRIAGEMLTDATGTAGCVTVIAAVPLCPSLVAVIVAVPAPCAVTSPVVLTIAMAALLDVQVTTRPVSGLPLASRGVAVNWPVCPTVRFRLVGDTPTDATGTMGWVTVLVAVPLWPSLVAVIVAVPAPCPVTSPVLFTVATAALLEVHVITRPLSGLPLASRGVAVSWPVCPTLRLRATGVTPTDATGTALTLTTAESVTPPAVVCATTVYEPACSGAWYCAYCTPPTSLIGEMLPPFVVHRRETSTVSALAVSATTTKSAVRSVSRVRLEGERSNLATASGGAVDRADGNLHAVIATKTMTEAVHNRARRCASLCKKVMITLPLGQSIMQKAASIDRLGRWRPGGPSERARRSPVAL